MRVFSVDDLNLSGQVVRPTPDLSGWAVEETSEAETGLTTIDTRDYDLVLMDLRTPGVDGLTALREIRARGESKGKIPILVVTGDAGARLRGAVDATGDDAQRLKPAAVEALYKAIGRTLAAVEEQRVVLL